MIVRDPLVQWKYVLKRERDLPREQQTVWHLRHLALMDEALIFDGLIAQAAVKKPMNESLATQRFTSCRKGLVGWENLQHVTRGEIQFEAGPLGGASDAMLQRIPVGDLLELGDAIENEVEYDPNEQETIVPLSADAGISP